MDDEWNEHQGLVSFFTDRDLLSDHFLPGNIPPSGLYKTQDVPCSKLSGGHEFPADHLTFPGVEYVFLPVAGQYPHDLVLFDDSRIS